MDILKLTKDLQVAVDQVTKLRGDVAAASAALKAADAALAQAIDKATALHQQYLNELSDVLPGVLGGKHTVL